MDNVRITLFADARSMSTARVSHQLPQLQYIAWHPGT